MTYQCGLQGFKNSDIEPHIFCDKCGTKLFIKGLKPPAWLLNKKAPKGWKCIIKNNFREDYCPDCKGNRKLL